MFYIYHKIITEASQTSLEQLNGRIKWANKQKKRRWKIVFAASFQMSASLKIKKLIIYCTGKSPRQKKKNVGGLDV